MSSSTAPESLLRIRDLMSRLQISRSTYYELLDAKLPGHDHTMPRPFKIGSATYFLEQEINSWIRQRVESSRKDN